MSKPSISLNKLGEYLTATPARRRSIVKDQMEPKPYVVTHYSDAREAITNFLEKSNATDQNLIEAAEKLKAQPHPTQSIADEKALSAEAIYDFLEVRDQINNQGHRMEKVAKNEQRKMEISGVDISVRPDLLVKDDSDNVVGALKLHFSKTFPLNKDAGEYVATGMRAYLEQEYGKEKIDPKLCTVVDVPTSNIVQAPKAAIKRMKDISAACEEIDARWKAMEAKSSK